MKIHLIRIFSLVFFLSGCRSLPFSATDATRAPIVATPIVFTATGTTVPTLPVTPQSPTVTVYPSTPTFIFASLPDDLMVAYVVEDKLWIWKQEPPQLLTQQQNISAPVISDDGQWILFRQRHIQSDGNAPPSDELWVVRTDGSELHSLVGSDDLKALTSEEGSILINDIDWLPGRHEILFNTERGVDGPPGSWPAFDLFSLDLSGHVTRLAEPGKGGKFIPSPDGLHIALATNSRIGLLDLETGEQRTLLEFKPVELGCECLRIPDVVWDPQGDFVMTSILPQKLYYPEEYAGEPEKVWRLFVNGRVELIAQLQPVSQNHAGIAISPNRQYFFYLNGYCPDAMGMLYVRNLTSAEEFPLTCVWNIPQWAPDSEHFIYKLGPWQLGNIYTNISQPLELLNVPTDPDVYASPHLIWIDQKYYLLVLRSRDVCTLSIATLQGMVTEIASTSPDSCPWRVDFNLSR